MNRKEKINLDEIEVVEESFEYDDRIDLIDYIRFILRKWYLVILFTLIGASFGFYKFTKLAPVYSCSSGKLYMAGDFTKIDTNQFYSNLNFSIVLNGDDQYFFKVRPTLEAVIDQLDLKMSVEQLASCVNINNPSGTHILEVTATASSPELAAKIANSVMEQGCNKLAEAFNQKPYIIEEAFENSARINNYKFTYMRNYGFVWAFIIIVLLTLKYVMNDTIKTREDVEEYVGIPIIGTVLEERNIRSK